MLPGNTWTGTKPVCRLDLDIDELRFILDHLPRGDMLTDELEQMWNRAYDQNDPQEW